jgi:hypothetical protein
VSKDFVTELGYLGEEEIVHRDNICLLSQRRFQANLSDANLPEHADAEEQEGACTLRCRVLCKSLFFKLQVQSCEGLQLTNGPFHSR